MTDTKPTVNTFSAFAPLLIQKYESYLPSAFDESMTLLQKMNKVINSLNTLGTNFNSVVDQWNSVVTWTEGDGLTKAVDDLLTQWKNDGTLANLLNDETLNEVSGGVVNIIHYQSSCPVDANGVVTNWDIALKSAHDALPNGGTIIVPKGDFPFTSFVITNHFITVTGSGNLINGTITIGQDVAERTYERMHTKINVNMKRDTQSSSINAIELIRSYWVDIEGCYFYNYNAAVYIKPLSLGGTAQVHSLRIRIDGCTGERINYLFRCPPNLSGGAMAAGDITIVNCNPVKTIKSAIFAEGLDGLLCSNNIFTITPDYEDGLQPSTDTQYKDKGIYINVGAQIIITNNHIFEAGREGIHLNACQYLTVGNNNIIWAGENYFSAGLRISGGDPVGTEYCIGTVTDNTIVLPSGGGVSIEDTCGHIMVTGNVIRSAGDTSKYTGTEDQATRPQFGIRALNTTKDIVTGINSLSAGWTNVDNQSTGVESSSIINQTLNIKSLYTTGDVEAHSFAYSDDNTRQILFGAGNPEGAVTAGMGSIFLNANGGFDATLYVKISGAGNTGWYPLNYTQNNFLASGFAYYNDSSRKIFWSAGDPEGVQTAGVGSLYLRTDGAAGLTLYVKETGTGNTGWVAK